MLKRERSGRSETLKIAAYDGDLVRLHLPPGADETWVRDMADPAHDLAHPLKGPFRALREGGAGLARAALQIAKSAHLLPSVLMVALDGAEAFARREALTLLDLAQVAPELAAASGFAEIAAARVPIAASQAGRVHVFRPDLGGEDHYAIEIGTPPRDRPVLARLHSACFTGDVLGSLKCDCGAQLAAALGQMGAEGAGVLLYLNQEGRGIGLINKIKAYKLQDNGRDTVQANLDLGFPEDLRDYGIGAQILVDLGVRKMRMMTNNPKKIHGLEGYDLEVVERVPIEMCAREENRYYLQTKRDKMGHIFANIK